MALDLCREFRTTNPVRRMQVEDPVGQREPLRARAQVLYRRKISAGSRFGEEEEVESGLNDGDDK